MEDIFEKWLEKHIADMANYPEESGGRSMLKMALHKYRTLKSKEEPLSTPDLIAELERRRPKCSVETCGHIGSELCGTCIWGVFIGEEDGSIKDNFKEAK